MFAHRPYVGCLDLGRAYHGTIASALVGRTGTESHVTLDVPLGGNANVSVVVEDDASPQWRVESTAPAARIGIDLSEAPLLVKYDGAPYVLEHHAATGAPPLSYKLVSSYKGACFPELARPGGKRLGVPSSGVIDSTDAPGVYLLRLTFTKKARLSVEAPGASPVLFLASDQGTYRLKKRRGRPAF